MNWNIEWRLSRGVFEESCSGNPLYVLKYVAELSDHNKDKVTEISVKESFLKTLRNDFEENSEKTLLSNDHKFVKRVKY